MQGGQLGVTAMGIDQEDFEVKQEDIRKRQESDERFGVISAHEASIIVADREKRVDSCLKEIDRLIRHAASIGRRSIYVDTMPNIVKERLLRVGYVVTNIGAGRDSVTW